MKFNLLCFTLQIDASLFLDKRQRLDPIDEYEGGEGNSATFMKRFKELARSRIKRKKRKGKSKSKKKKKQDKDGAVVKKKRLVLDLGTIDATEWESDDEDGEGNEEEDKINIPGQVEALSEQVPPTHTAIQPVLGKRNSMVDRKVSSQPEGKRKKKKKKKVICTNQHVNFILEMKTDNECRKNYILLSILEYNKWHSMRPNYWNNNRNSKFLLFTFS